MRRGFPPPLLTSGNQVGSPIKRCGVATEKQRSLGEDGQLDHLASRSRRKKSVLLPLLLYQMWHNSQADPTRAAFPTGHPVVSSKIPEASARTHTHNWCGWQRQAANTTQRCEAQRLLASLGGVRDCSAASLRYTHRSPSLNPQGDPRKWAKNGGQTRATPAAGGVPKTPSKHANKIPKAKVRCTENTRLETSQQTKRTNQGCGHNSEDRGMVFPGITSGSSQPLSDRTEWVS